MEASPLKRRLAAILAADVVGYSRMVAENEEATLRTLGIYRSTIGDMTSEHGGRVFGTAGDSVIAEFASAVQAVRAAVAIQRALQRRNADLSQGRRMEFRIGVNLGDVVAEGDDLLGDGVNIAARLQEVAAPGGICLSGAVREQIEGKLDFPLSTLGERSLKNIPRPVPVYRVDWSVDATAVAAVLGGEFLCTARQAVDCRAALCQYERRSGARLLRRRHHRGNHHGAVALSAGSSSSRATRPSPTRGGRVLK